MGIETAILGAAIIGGGSAAYAANKASSAQSKAAAQGIAAQEKAAADATALQREMFNKQVELQEPFRQAGLTSQNQLLDLLGLSGNTGAAGYGSAAQPFSMSAFQQDPGYQFRLEEGQKALERSTAARAGLQSGGALKAAARYGQDYGSQEYQNAFNRYQTERAAKINPLLSILGAGQTSTNALTNAAGTTGTNLSNTAMSLGNNLATGYGNLGQARASGYVGMGNALNTALSGGTNAYMMNQFMNRMPMGGAGTYNFNAPYTAPTYPVDVGTGISY